MTYKFNTIIEDCVTNKVLYNYTIKTTRENAEMVADKHCAFIESHDKTKDLVYSVKCVF